MQSAELVPNKKGIIYSHIPTNGISECQITNASLASIHFQKYSAAQQEGRFLPPCSFRRFYCQNLLHILLGVGLTCVSLKL